MLRHEITYERPVFGSCFCSQVGSGGTGALVLRMCRTLGLEDVILERRGGCWLNVSIIVRTKGLMTGE